MRGWRAVWGWMNDDESEERAQKKMLGRSTRRAFVWLYGIFFSLSIFFVRLSRPVLVWCGAVWVGGEMRKKAASRKEVLYSRGWKKSVPKRGEKASSHIGELVDVGARKPPHSFGRKKASFTIHFFCANHFYVFKHHECFMYCHDSFFRLLRSMDITPRLYIMYKFVFTTLGALSSYWEQRVRREAIPLVFYHPDCRAFCRFFFSSRPLYY